MKMSDVISELQKRLPLQTDLFNETFDIDSATVDGEDITFTTSEEHGLSVGDSVVVDGVDNGLSIESYTIADSIATLTFTTDHGYNYDKGYTQTIKIVNSDDADGEYTLLSVPSYTTLTIEFDGSAISGDDPMIVLHNGFNGGYEVTAVDDVNSFTVTARDDIFDSPQTAISGGTASVRIRISGAADMQRFNDVYTAKKTDEIWLVVTPAQNRSSRDRDVPTDAISGTTQAALGVSQVSIKQAHIETIELYAVIPASAELAGRLAADVAEEIRWFLYKSLVCADVPTLGAEGETYAIMPVSDGYFSYLTDNTTYTHRYIFERTVYMSTVDVSDPDAQTAPFRGLDLSVEFADLDDVF